jgi:hypothetical protein
MTRHEMEQLLKDYLMLLGVAPNAIKLEVVISDDIPPDADATTEVMGFDRSGRTIIKVTFRPAVLVLRPEAVAAHEALHVACAPRKINVLNSWVNSKGGKISKRKLREMADLLHEFEETICSGLEPFLAVALKGLRKKVRKVGA